MNKLPYLNLGCGATFDKNWTNIDFASFSPEVKEYNLLKGIPYPDNSFDLVYHSHILEHFPKKDAYKFIAECHRVLKPGGIIRVVVPDLEQIALNYIKYLNESLEGIPGASEKYNWTMIEMYDQVVRDTSGGEMVEYIKDLSKNNDQFLLDRNGKEIELLMQSVREQKANRPEIGLRKLFSHLYHTSIKALFKNVVMQYGFAGLRKYLFRSQGEIHQWMYDRYSIKGMLENQGFVKVEKKTAFTSYLPQWSEYKLDGENGKIRKPDSLFIEAVK